MCFSPFAACFPASIVHILTKPLFSTVHKMIQSHSGEKKQVVIKADKTNHFPVWVVSYYIWTRSKLEWGHCCWWEVCVWMPGAVESLLCISEKLYYEWSHAYSALVDVMTEWGVAKRSVTVLTHNNTPSLIFMELDPDLQKIINSNTLQSATVFAEVTNNGAEYGSQNDSDGSASP